MSSGRREHLVSTALELFSSHGYHATGIDRILARSGVAKATLYKHFKGKDELIVAALRLQDLRVRNWLTECVDRAADTPVGRLLTLFDAYELLFQSGDYYGCLFIHASAEFARHDHPIHAAAVEHKRFILGYLRGLATSAGAENPEELAQQIQLLAEGAYVNSQMMGSADAARQAREAAWILIGHAWN